MLQIINGLHQLYLVRAAGYLGGGLVADFAQQVVRVYHALLQAHLGSLAYPTAQCHYAVVVCDGLTYAAHLGTLLLGLQAAVEGKHLALQHHIVACVLQLPTRCLRRIQAADVPVHAHPHNAVERPSVAHHILKHVESRIAVVALCEECHTRSERHVDHLLACLQQSHLRIHQPQLGALRVVPHRLLGHRHGQGRLAQLLTDEEAQYAAEALQAGLHLSEALALRQQLHLHSISIGLHGHPVLHEGIHLVEVGLQALHHLPYLPLLLLHQQYAEVDVLYTAVYRVQLHLGTHALLRGLALGDGPVGTALPAIPEGLLHINLHLVLVAAYARHVKSLHGQHRLELLGPAHHVGLQRGLPRERHLRQPRPGGIAQRVVAALLYQPIPSDERIVLARHLLAPLHTRLCTYCQRSQQRGQ